MFKIDSAGATVDNQFTEGNPQSGIPATVISADWLNAVQNEIVNVLISRGITLDKTKSSQLSEWLQRGIDGWYSNLTYAKNSICQINGKLYISQLDSNINHNPATDDGTYWKSKIILSELDILTNLNIDLLKTKTANGNLLVKNQGGINISSFKDNGLFASLGDCRYIGDCPAGGTYDFYLGRYGVGLVILFGGWGGATGVHADIYMVTSQSFSSYISAIAALGTNDAFNLSYVGYTDPYMGVRYAQKFRCTCASYTGASVYFKPFLEGDGDRILQPIS